MASVAHIINPYKTEIGSDAHRTQELVMQSLLNARAYSAHKSLIRLCTTQFADEKNIIPEGFQILTNLTRSVADIHQFSKKRPYPLIRDILQILYESTDADYLIYTNMDILVMPFFYDAIFQFIKQGYDAFVINRRRISKKFMNGFTLEEIYAEVGKSHPGFDCFVWKRSLFPSFILQDVCIGIPFVEASLLYNMVAFSNRFRLFPDKHLTIHIGMEVMPQRDNEYYTHNKNEFQQKILPRLKPFLKAKNLPYSELPFYQRFIKWGLNPAVFVFLNTELEARGWLDKLRLLKDEIRFGWLQKD